LWTTFVEGGKGSRGAPSIHACAGRTGRRAKPPPQFGHTFDRTLSTQSRQRALVRADHRVGRVGRERAVAVLARGSELEHVRIIALASRKLTGRKTAYEPPRGRPSPPAFTGRTTAPQKCPVKDSLVGKRSDDSRGPLSGRVIEHDGVPVATAREWSLSVRRGSAWRTRLLLPARERKAGEARLARSLVVHCESALGINLEARSSMEAVMSARRGGDGVLSGRARARRPRSTFRRPGPQQEPAAMAPAAKIAADHQNACVAVHGGLRRRVGRVRGREAARRARGHRGQQI
jgi:hypothetical protein